MEYNVDTVIIGGGPAGSSLATVLARNGVSSLIVEKRAFPREKVCGGLMTDKTYKLVKDLLAPDGGELASDLFCDVSDDIELWYKTERLAVLKVKKPLRKIKRRDFDARLIENYKSLGGTLLENSECAAIDMTAHRATLKNGDEIAFRRLVAADGALSPTRKLLGCQSPRLNFCTETHVGKPGRADDGVVRIHFGVTKGGYGWVFPHGDELCVGLGGICGDGERFDRVLLDYLAMNGLPTDCRIGGAFIPSGELVDQKRAPDDAILVGDAGGFIDPLTGEGLYFALYTGIAAANAVVKSAKTGADFKEEFQKNVAPAVKIIRQGYKTQGSFYSSIEKSAFRGRIAGRNGFVGYFCDNMLSEYNYQYSKIWELGLDYKRGKSK